jgi:hypothetical protein
MVFSIMNSRRAIRRLAALWLTCQIVVVLFVPVMLASSFVDNETARQIVCTCTDEAPNAACPVHHGHSGHGHSDTNQTAQRPSNTRTVCYLRSASDSPTALLTSLFTVVGLVSERAPILAPAFSTSTVTSNAAISFQRPVPPDPPPPRA